MWFYGAAGPDPVVAKFEFEIILLIIVEDDRGFFLLASRHAFDV